MSGVSCRSSRVKHITSNRRTARPDCKSWQRRKRGEELDERQAGRLLKLKLCLRMMCCTNLD